MCPDGSPRDTHDETAMSAANQFRQTIGRLERGPSYEFSPFVLDTMQHALLRDGNPVALTPKTYDMLLLLIRNSGRMLSKEELMKALWPDSFVDESNLTQQISMIRRALGDSASEPRYIVTVPCRAIASLPKSYSVATKRSGAAGMF